MLICTAIFSQDKAKTDAIIKKHLRYQHIAYSTFGKYVAETLKGKKALLIIRRPPNSKYSIMHEKATTEVFKKALIGKVKIIATHLWGSKPGKKDKQAMAMMMGDMLTSKKLEDILAQYNGYDTIISF